jgi:hypothetical protein
VLVVLDIAMMLSVLFQGRVEESRRSEAGSGPELSDSRGGGGKGRRVKKERLKCFQL